MKKLFSVNFWLVLILNSCAVVPPHVHKETNVSDTTAINIFNGSWELTNSNFVQRDTCTPAKIEIRGAQMFFNLQGSDRRHYSVFGVLNDSTFSFFYAPSRIRPDFDLLKYNSKFLNKFFYVNLNNVGLSKSACERLITSFLAG
jgi:hypothetical protein